MREKAADAVIARVRQSIAARTSDALRRVVIELAPAHTAVALAIREAPFDDLPATVAAVRTSYRLLCAADGMGALYKGFWTTVILSAFAIFGVTKWVLGDLNAAIGTVGDKSFTGMSVASYSRQAV